MNKTPQRRRRKLIQPALQIRLVASFVGLAALAMGTQFLLMGYRLVEAATELDGAGGQLADQVPTILVEVFLVSLGLLLPVIFLFGIVMTFPIAGPIHRFEQYLRAVSRGEQLGPCKIRDGDQLQDLCDAINEATEPLRRRRDEQVETETAGELRSVG